MTQEHTGHPQFQALNYLVREARHNAQMARELGETDPNDHLGPNAPEILIQHLVQQGPNRIYCSPEGQIARVFFYRGEFDYEAYMETQALRALQASKLPEVSFWQPQPQEI